MFEESPNGYFINDLIIFNSLNQGGYVAKGYIFEPPDMVNAQVSELNQFQDQLTQLMAALKEQQRLQIQYYCDSDYRRELLRYQAETEKAGNLWTRRSRNERFERYWRLMTDRQLRRQRLVFYLSRKIETSANGIKSSAALTEYYHNILSQLRGEFEQKHEMLTDIFAGQGARIIPMKDADHFRHYKTFLNPSLAERFDYDPIEGFDPQLSIQENCWHSEGSGQADFGFFMDGRYHSIIALSRWPKMTYPGIIHRLTSLRLLDLGAGGGVIANQLSHGDPGITAAGAAGGVLLSEGGFYLAGKQSDKAYVTGYEKGRSDAVKQQYWVQVRQQQHASTPENVSLYAIPVPEQAIDGTILNPTTKYLRIEE